LFRAQANCTSDVLVENIVITLGVGASIGSVRPNPNVNCVRNITFRNIEFHSPIKVHLCGKVTYFDTLSQNSLVVRLLCQAIYVKPNPGTVGTGIIDNVLYENIVAKNPLWWAIWVSTQQQVNWSRFCGKKLRFIMF
jgi:hypothetical protein